MSAPAAEAVGKRVDEPAAPPPRALKWGKRAVFVVGILTILHFLFDVIPAPIGSPGDYGTGYVSCADLGSIYLQDHHGVIAHVRVFLAEQGCSDSQ